MDPLLIGLAFVLGFGARQAGQPPLVGFLVAGFVAHALQIEPGDWLNRIANLGVTLLLFLIGLELDMRRLFKPEVWGTAIAHAGITITSVSASLLALGAVGVVSLAGLGLASALTLGFALSFSSTVLAVKNLEDRGERTALHGRTAIGVLVLQDLFAVAYLSFAGGKLPEPWAIGLIAVLALRPVLLALLNRVGHGELLLLFGLFAAVGLGASWFGRAGIKPDLGALVLGAIMAGHPKAKELAESLFPIKNLLLVGFFIQIGLNGFPDWEHFLLSLGLVLFVAVKAALFFLLLTRFCFRARSAVLGATALASYSEFGLIVTALAVQTGWLAEHWSVTVAIAIAASFIVAVPLQQAAHNLHTRRTRWLVRFERRRRHPEEAVVRFGDTRVAVLGMGRIGTGAYDALCEQAGPVVVGVELDASKVAQHREAGRHVVRADVTDPAFWQRLERGKVELVLLAMPQHGSNIYAFELLKASHYDGRVAAIARFSDEVEVLQAAGVDVAFDMYAEAGAGFASHVQENLGGLPQLAKPATKV